MRKPLKVDFVLNFVGIMLVIGFIIRIAADYYKYQKAIDTTPFYLLLIGRSLVFLLPSIIFFIVAIYLKKLNWSK